MFIIMFVIMLMICVLTVDKRAFRLRDYEYDSLVAI